MTVTDDEFPFMRGAAREADHDVQRFLMRYFLADDGKHCRAKTPTPIAFPGLINGAAVHQAAKSD